MGEVKPQPNVLTFLKYMNKHLSQQSPLFTSNQGVWEEPISRTVR